MKLITFAILLGWIILATIADVLFKSDEVFSWKFFGGLALYAISAFPAVYVFKKIDFSGVVMVWNAVSIGIGVLIGILFYKDEITFVKASILALTIAVVILANFDQAPKISTQAFPERTAQK